METTLGIAEYTDIGERSVNEDCFGIAGQGDRTCIVLCDGLGGHGMGDAAARLVTDACLEYFAAAGGEKLSPGALLEKAQERLLAVQRERNATQKMKTTAVLLLTDRKYARIGHVGDSRLYVFSDNRVRSRTLDHSVPQMLALTGDITEEEIRFHPERDKLLRVLGVPWETPQSEVEKPVQISKCQAFLLCSDGFWEWIGEAEMCRLLAASASEREWLDAMVAVVRERSRGRTPDNRTAVAVWVRRPKRTLWKKHGRSS